MTKPLSFPLSYSKSVQSKTPWRRGLFFTSQHLSSVTHQMRMTEDGLSEDQASLSLSGPYTAAQQANTAGSPGMLTLSEQLNSVSCSEGLHQVLGCCPQDFQLSILVVGSFWPLRWKPSFPSLLCLQNSLTNISTSLSHQWPLSNTFLTHLRCIPVPSFFGPYRGLTRTPLFSSR